MVEEKQSRRHSRQTKTRLDSWAQKIGFKTVEARSLAGTDPTVWLFKVGAVLPFCPTLLTSLNLCQHHEGKSRCRWRTMCVTCTTVHQHIMGSAFKYVQRSFGKTSLCSWFFRLQDKVLPLIGATIPSVNMSLAETLNPSHFLRRCLPLLTFLQRGKVKRAGGQTNKQIMLQTQQIFWEMTEREGAERRTKEAETDRHHAADNWESFKYCVAIFSSF